MHPILKRAPKGALAILGFHNITPTFSQPQLSPDFPGRFRKLCRTIRSRYDVVTVSEGMRRVQEGVPADRPMLAFIFDDGYADTANCVMPIMKSEGLVGTSYIIVDALEHGTLPWYEELGRLVYRMKGGTLNFEMKGHTFSFQIPDSVDQREFVFWHITREMKKYFDATTHGLVKDLQVEYKVTASDEEARDMMMTPDLAKTLLDASFEVGCHSWTHPILPTLGDADLDHEIVDSKPYLEGLIDHEVTSFCYPNGDNDERCIERAERAGYICAVSMACGANLPQTTEPYRLKRAAMSEEITWMWPYKTAYHVHAALAAEPS
ncbi:MAG: peptidoglycan/xylan/chitin deacetylase (PgdA/CDA1 family) [Planctomycetota bacterium]|jgi:peptidoglycan/xylan/chitin deacetylase (PgdA/CDA1 family)